MMQRAATWDWDGSMPAFDSARYEYVRVLSPPWVKCYVLCKRPPANESLVDRLVRLRDEPAGWSWDDPDELMRALNADDDE